MKFFCLFLDLFKVLCFVLLSGCANLLNNNNVTLSNSLSYTLTAPPASYISNIDRHLVDVIYNQQQYSFIAQVEYSDNQIAMVALSKEGLPIFDFIWQTDKPIKINRYIPLPSINIKNIIADMQLCYWPLTLITSSVRGEKIDVYQQDSVSDAAIIWQRTISQNNQIIIKIDKSKQGYELVHVLRNYRLKLTNLNLDEI